MFFATFVELSSFIFLDRRFHVFLRSFNLRLLHSYALYAHCLLLFLFLFFLVFNFFNFWLLVSFASFWFVFLFQLLNPISRNLNFFMCASLCIFVNNFTKNFFSSWFFSPLVVDQIFQHDVDIEIFIVGLFFPSCFVITSCFTSML